MVRCGLVAWPSAQTHSLSRPTWCQCYCHCTGVYTLEEDLQQIIFGRGQTIQRCWIGGSWKHSPFATPFIRLSSILIRYLSILKQRSIFMFQKVSRYWLLGWKAEETCLVDGCDAFSNLLKGVETQQRSKDWVEGAWKSSLRMCENQPCHIWNMPLGSSFEGKPKLKVPF